MNKHLPFKSGRHLPAPLCLLILGLAIHLPLHAQSTWSGGGANANWSTSANWNVAPASGNTLNFGGILQTVTNNDLTADTSFGPINFTNDGTTGKTGAFTLAGNRIILGGTISLTAVSGTTIEDTISLDMVLNSTRIVDAATNHSLKITGIISGSGGLSKQGGSGTLLTLTALNTFTGTVTLTSGTIAFNTIANSGTASALGAGGTIVAGSSGGTTGTLQYTGTGSSTNRQIQIGTGSTVTSTVGLILQSDGTGTLAFTNNAFNVAFATSTATKTLTLRGTNTGNNLISGAIIDNNTAGGGKIAVTKTQAGTWALAGTNTYTGGTTVTTGVLTFLNTGAKPSTGTTTVAAGATLGLGVGTSGTLFTSADVNSLFAGTMTNVTNDVASNVGLDTTAGDFTYATSIATTTRGLTKLGAGTLTLTGVNAYTGTTSIAGGVLDVGTISAGALGSGGLFLSNNAVLQGNGTFTRTLSGNSTPTTGQVAAVNGGFAAKGGTLTINFGGAGATVSLSTGNSRFGGNLVFGSATADSKVIVVNPLGLNTLTRTFTVNSGVGGDSAELQGAISGGDATDGIIKEGAGLLILSAANTYTGTTTINAGTLQLGSGGSTGSINGTSGIINNGALALNRTGTLNISTAISGTGVVTQTGSSLTNVSGANTYSGGTNVNAGTLSFLNTGAKPAAGTVTVASSATLGLGVGTAPGFFTSTDVDNLFAGTLAGVSNSTTSRVGIDTTAGNFTYASNASGTRGLTKLGANTLSLTGTNTYTGRTTITDGILKLDSTGAIPGGIGSTGGTSTIAFNGGIIGLTATSGDFTRGIGTGAGQVLWITDAAGGFAAFGGNRSVNFGGSATPSTVTWSNSGGVLGDSILLSDSTSDSTITILNPIALSNSASSRTITVNNGTADIDAVMAGALSSQLTASNGTRLIKSGAGTLALTATNSYVSGSSPVGTTISAGTLMLGNGGTTGSLLYVPSTTGINSDVTISSGATFAFNRSDTGLTVANLIIGAGSVAQAGTGSATLSNANTYSGGTTVSKGTLLVTNTSGSATGTGAVTVAGSTILGGTGIIAPTGTNGVSVAGTIAPGLPGVTDGAGTLTFTMADGSVALASTAALALQLRSHGTNGLTLTYNPDGTIATISGTGSSTGSDRLVFTASGTGLLDFTQASAGSIGVTFTGGYTPQALDAFDLLDWSNLGTAGLATNLLSLPTLTDPNLFWDISKFTSDGVIAIAQNVPEPSRGMLLLGGLWRVCLRRRRC